MLLNNYICEGRNSVRRRSPISTIVMGINIVYGITGWVEEMWGSRWPLEGGGEGGDKERVCKFI